MPFIKIICIELLLTCLHSDVLIKPLNGQFLSLLVKIMIRMEICVAQWVNVMTPTVTKEVQQHVAWNSSITTAEALSVRHRMHDNILLMISNMSSGHVPLPAFTSLVSDN